ncbi:MAG: hypothetical protein ACE5G8_15435 [Anaerolineae bacterium]
MIDAICQLLKLDPRAGLGWRLAQLSPSTPAARPTHIHLRAADPIEAGQVAHALTVRAAQLGLPHVHVRVTPLPNQN